MIELKEIVGHLPYGLKICFPKYNKYVRRMNALDLQGRNPELRATDIKTYKTYYGKPLLCPLSQLTEDKWKDIIYIEGRKQFTYTNEHLESVINDAIVRPDFMPLWLAEFCYENHFDIHGLIERGDAIEMEEE